MKRLLLPVALLVGLHLPLVSQSDSTLKGITTVAAMVILIPPQGTDGPTYQQLQYTMSSKLSLELRKLGLVVSNTSPYVVRCEATMYKPKEVASIFFASMLTFAEPVTILRTGKKQTVVTWFGSMPAGVFDADKVDEKLQSLATQCAETFGNAWLAANPKKP